MISYIIYKIIHNYWTPARRLDTHFRHDKQFQQYTQQNDEMY